MKAILSPEETIEEPVCLMIGNFDGVHRGHQSVIDRARALAAELGCKTAVLSFEPHPLKILAPEKAPKLLATPAQKQALLAVHGVDYHIVQKFDRDFSRLSPEAFVARVKARVNFIRLLVGFNFRFGHRRQGSPDTLRQLAEKYRFLTESMPASVDGGQVISSSRIRDLIRKGRVDQAAELLGRPYFLEGLVKRGRRLGRQIGAPTANMSVENELLPKFGVYAGWARHRASWRRAIANIGVAPTVHSHEPLIETHLFDFDGSLYDQRLTLCLGAFLRPEAKFDSIEALKRQIRQDMTDRLAMPDTEPPVLPWP